MPKKRHARRTRIVTALGPASSDLATIHVPSEAGVDVFRLNASHGTHAGHAARHATPRGIERQANHPVAVLMDLQEPKLRAGAFVNGKAELHEGQAFRLDLDPALGDATCAAVRHPELSAALVPEKKVLLDDGRNRLRVVRCGPDYAGTTVVSGGALSGRRGVDLPGVNLPLSALSTEDRQGLAFALDLGADWIGLPLVQRPEDVEDLLLDLPCQRFAACRAHLQFSPARGAS